MSTIASLYGSMVFNDDKMKKRAFRLMCTSVIISV